MSSLETILADNGAFSPVRAQAHLTLLRVFCAVYDTLGSAYPGSGATADRSEWYATHFLRAADYRYRLYLDMLVSMQGAHPDTWPLPQWDVALIMHAHMLSPIKFANSISTSPRYSGLAGKISFPLLKLVNAIQNRNTPSNDIKKWNARYGQTPYELVKLTSSPQDTIFPPSMSINLQYGPQRFQPQNLEPLGLDLVSAVKRQIGFARKITALYPHDPVPNDLLVDSQQRYAKFMNLIRENAVANAVPALDIDLFWHTHQLEATNYLPWCAHYMGRCLNHDDTVADGPLDDGLQATTAAWEAFYNEDYINPAPGSGPTFQNAAPARPPPPAVAAAAAPTPTGPGQMPPAHPSRPPTTADKTPPAGLTPAQLELWLFDVNRQVRHQQIDTEYHEELERVRNYDRILANMGGPAATGAGTLSRLLRGALPNDRRSSIRASRAAAERRVQTLQRWAREKREEWGRERWPLLVQARGWGDAAVTAGRWTRPAQGTYELNFPVYAATWYDNKQLGYYDYVKSGRAGPGAIEGGGLALGGGQCGGRFDGGNCVAPVVHPPTVYRGGPSCNAGGGCRS